MSGKTPVNSTARRQQIGQRPMRAAKDAAVTAGRTLLLLDTESAGDLLYRNHGRVETGRIPNHSYHPGGRLAEATIFYRVLGPHLRRGE